ncbi:XRE family transcriptional regulator [Clostridium sporogenes]|uniref:helix-turn-helix domain-containing protein n=1 Tax=Clostridium sporogenes TaxID=1509 RepID=UPI00077FF9E1|nr:helix-turn-helix transcriptional regulator [Clostridium sporogenes]KYN75801.1 XRE family transcriptional regulator [Clostridium sporogenes]
MNNLIQMIGSNIRFLRKQKNFSQEELAFKANLHPTYIGQVERGEKNLTISNLNSITKALNITLEEFFSVIEPSNNKSRIKILYNINELLQNMNLEEQKQIFEFINLLIKWKKNN